MNKALNIIKILGILILAFVLQIIVANKFEIFGITPNILLVTVVIVSMWSSLPISLIMAGIIGAFADLIFYFSIGQSFVAYLAVALCISYISIRYRKESKAAIVYLTVISTWMFSFLQVIYYVLNNVYMINIFAVIKQLIVESLLNIAIAYIVYKLFEKSMKEDILNSVYR